MDRRPLTGIKGTGSKVENETVILWNEAEAEAVLNTASPTVYRKMIKKGFTPPPASNGNRAMFRFPKKAIRLPSQPPRRSGYKPPKQAT